MHHAPILLDDDTLRGPEKRVISLLRAWQAGAEAQSDIWDDLHASLGETRARSCLQGFEHMLQLLRTHGWQQLSVLPIGTKGASSDEAAIARFVMAATEQRREAALAEAGFLISPAGLLPLLCAASRVGLPLLCEECRSRILPKVPNTPLH